RVRVWGEGEQAGREPAQHGPGQHDDRADILLHSVLAEDHGGHYGVERGQPDQGREPESPLALSENFARAFMLPFIYSTAECAFHWDSPSWEKPKRDKMRP